MYLNVLHWLLSDIKVQGQNLDPSKSHPMVGEDRGKSSQNPRGGSALQALLQPSAGGYPQHSLLSPEVQQQQAYSMMSSSAANPNSASAGPGLMTSLSSTTNGMLIHGMAPLASAHMSSSNVAMTSEPPPQFHYGTAPPSPKAVPVIIESYADHGEMDSKPEPMSTDISSLNTVSITSG